VSDAECGAGSGISFGSGSEAWSSKDNCSVASFAVVARRAVR
jgi:hypothetical protein